jgi:hypothetical protein
MFSSVGAHRPDSSALGGITYSSFDRNPLAVNVGEVLRVRHHGLLFDTEDRTRDRSGSLISGVADTSFFPPAAGKVSRRLSVLLSWPFATQNTRQAMRIMVIVIRLSYSDLGGLGLGQ